ncbi:efflux RND transporter periplasmic adaptor subunit [Alphaproteobacteria bacterium GH1-50]|uniref:Efflux RND transporter periplasmic adaptor subunit n=1 Tax=Kangsaoukella pontilimi TaxID=2691042 RepID=A0A7C9IEJ9_9RHOB|nr:efflux RND transporter periplasmic adaptor subunit [Kangsaoukella pontilimi]MXQ06824.1 efflux RND transporter periplasmic adaptor subunit [Kangsaoukella pontilimi]
MSDTPLPLWKRLVRTLGRVTLTLVVTALAVGAVVTGTSVLAARSGEEIGPPPAPATPVAPVAVILQDSYAIERRFSGEIEPIREASLGFEARGSLSLVLVREGQRVAEGEALAEIDTRLLDLERARLAAARKALEADAELARRTNARQAELRERGFATDQRVDDTSLTLARAEAGLAELDAAIGAVEVQLEKAKIKAPFAGRVAARLLDEGTVVGPGAPVLALVEEGPVRFRTDLAADLASRLEAGTQVTVETEAGAFTASLTELSPTLDPATRARRAFFTLDGGAPPAGLTGEIVIRDQISVAEPGLWLPLSALRQGPRGTWTVLTVDAAENGDLTAGLAAVEIVHLDSGRAFVRGTFKEGDLLLGTGAHRVVPGERVRIPGQDEVLSWAR